MAMIEIDTDVYLDENVIVAALYDMHGEVCSENRTNIYKLFSELYEGHLVPGDKVVRAEEHELLTSVVNFLQRDLDKCKALLANDGFKDSKEVEVFRYVRRPANAFYSNLGGVTFLFRFENGVSPENDYLYASYAICSSDENFDCDKGREIAIAKYEDGDGMKMKYTREISLIDNVKRHLMLSSLHDKLTQTEKKLKKALITQCMEY